MVAASSVGQVWRDLGATGSPGGSTGALWGQALAVLAGNSQGTWTRPSPRLYPHQWSWDAAFIAIGLGWADPDRAVSELRSLLRGQWTSGLIPHIVFDADAGGYFPGPDVWKTDGCLHAPDHVRTSGLCQPPVHAIALARIRQAAGRRDLACRLRIDDAIRELYPSLFAWHRWLHTARDPGATGLVTIVHPWESGMDNSPRWDRALAAVEVGDLMAYERLDLNYVADPDERPSDREYDRYVWLVECLEAAGYDDEQIMAAHPFRVADVFFSAVLAAADDVLAELAEHIDAPEEEAAQLRTWGARTRAAVNDAWDEDLRLVVDTNRITHQPVRAATVAGFAPFIAGCDDERALQLIDRLWSPSFAGAGGMPWSLPPSNAVDAISFSRRAYWRGPIWPVITWLLWWSLDRDGRRRTADRLRTAGLAQLAATGFPEYVEPYTGEGLGSDAQSWTAAVCLDWLASLGP